MREIKFRAWDKCNNKMLKEIDVIDFRCNDVCEDCFVRNSDKLESVWHKGVNIVLQQFTGLLDKNGK